MLTPGSILIAKPFLQESYFKRSVIYLCEHQAEGSLGFIVNKPHGLLLKDIFPHLKNGNFPVFEGGPVSSNQLFYIHTLGLKLSDSKKITKGVYWGGNFMELCHLIEHGKISSKQIHFFIGYSGWGEGQLNGELKSESWFCQTINYNEFMQTHPDNMWANELRKVNPSYKVFTDFGFDPSLN